MSLSQHTFTWPEVCKSQLNAYAAAACAGSDVVETPSLNVTVDARALGEVVVEGPRPHNAEAYALQVHTANSMRESAGSLHDGRHSRTQHSQKLTADPGFEVELVRTGHFECHIGCSRGTKQTTAVRT